MVDSIIKFENFTTLEVIKEDVQIKNFIIELGVVTNIVKLIKIYCDNNGAIAQAKEPRSH